MVSEQSEPNGSGQAGDWDGLIVLCAANNWDGIKLADQHIAVHLSRLAPVLFVDPPMSHLTPRNRPDLKGALEGPRLRRLGPGLARLTPVVPPKGRHPVLVPLTDRTLRQSLRRATRALGVTPRVVIVTQPTWPAFGAAGEDLAVFWAQDDFTSAAGGQGLDPHRVRQAELAAARAADVIITSSPTVRDQWVERGFEPVMIPFGCDASAFSRDCSSPATDVRVPTPVAGFIGHLNARLDLAVLEAVADTMSLLLIGPRGSEYESARFDRLLTRSNVQWIGPQPFERLPAYLARIDVGLVPYTHSGFNLGSFPLKTLEYLAAGLPVVATDLPATRWLGTELVVIEDAPARFAAAALVATRSRRDTTIVAARRAFAASHDWSTRADQMAELFASRVERGAQPGVRT